MENQAGGLLQRILASRHFAHADMLKRILRYICTHSQDADSTLSEYAIALESIGRPEKFDPKLDPIVRVSMTSIRQRLDSYFADEGKNELLKLEISKGRYRARFVPNEQTPVEAPVKPVSHSALGPSVARFWQPYFEDSRANILVHSEPLFLRDDHGTRIRHIHLNNPATAPQEIAEILPTLRGSTFVPYYAYLTVGTVYCMLAVTRVFYEAGAALEVRSSRSCGWQELRDSNLVLAGNAGANTYLDSLQGDDGFVLEIDCVRNADPQVGEQQIYHGQRYFEGSLQRHREYAVITRRPGLSPGSAITIIGAMHGKAIEGAGQFLTSEDQLCPVLETLGNRAGHTLAAHFQLLMEIDMIDIADEVVNVACVAHRLFPARS